MIALQLSLLTLFISSLVTSIHHDVVNYAIKSVLEKIRNKTYVSLPSVQVNNKYFGINIKSGTFGPLSALKQKIDATYAPNGNGKLATVSVKISMDPLNVTYGEGEVSLYKKNVFNGSMSIVCTPLAISLKIGLKDSGGGNSCDIDIKDASLESSLRQCRVILPSQTKLAAVINKINQYILGFFDNKVKGLISKTLTKMLQFAASHLKYAFCLAIKGAQWLNYFGR